MTWETKLLHGYKLLSSVNGAGQTEYSHEKDENESLSYTIHKNLLEMD